jgi:hypothetical protein
MLLKTRNLWAVVGVVLLAGSVQAAALTDSLKQGTPDVKSATSLAFAPEGILLVGDPMGAAIFAIDTNDRPSQPATGKLAIEKVNEKLAGMLGTDAKGVTINDLAVNPMSGNAYMSVSRGQGAQAAPVLFKISRQGKIEEFPLKSVKFAKAELPNPPAPNAKGKGGGRGESITGLAYVDGKVIVAGLSNEEFASNLRAIPFPFTDTNKGASVEIFHGAHGRFETQSPVRTFAVYDIKGEANLLAAYTCTPLVKFPVSQLKPGEKVKGTTVAELGNRNRPLDMVVYQKDGKDFVLIANSSRGVMKVNLQGVDNIKGITERINGTAGLTYDTLKELKGVEQLTRLDKDQALILVRTDAGAQNLETIQLP